MNFVDQPKTLQAPETDPILLLGCERSGTTLLAALLDRHSQVAVPPETFFFSDVVYHGPFRRKGFKDHAKGLNIALKGRLGEFSVDREALLRRYQNYPPDLPSLFKSILQQIAFERGKPQAAEKCVMHILFLPDLFQWFPKSKAVIIVRDGRDCVHSMMSPPWKPNKLYAKACNWREKMRLAIRWKSLFPERVYLLRYEDLLQKTEATLSTMNNFLGLTFEPRQLDVSLHPGVYLEREKPHKAKSGEALDAARVSAWKKTLSAKQIWAMNAVMGPYLKALGYPESNLQGCPPISRFKVYALALLWIGFFKVFMFLKGLIIYDKIRRRWLRRQWGRFA